VVVQVAREHRFVAPRRAAGGSGVPTVARAAADVLVIAAQTARTHVGGILRKLAARDRAQAIVVAYESALVAGRQRRQTGGSSYAAAMPTTRTPAFLADHRPSDRPLALTGARVVDVTDGTVRTAAAIVVRDGRIAEVVDDPRDVPGDATPVDVSDRYVLPGLIDVHAHLSMIEHGRHRPTPPKGAEPLHDEVRGHLVAATLRRALRMGITTIRDVGAYGDVVLQVRQAMRYGALVGPRLFACGRIVSPTAPGARFFPQMYREADGPDDMRRAAREQLRAGADFVKIMTTGARTVELEDPNPAQVTPAEVEALVGEAHRQGYRVAAHCEGLGGTEVAVTAGVDTIEHGMYLNQRPELLAALAARGGVLVPTLSFLHHVADDGTWTPELTAQGRHNVEQAQLTIAAAREHGVRVAVGFDSPDADLAATELCTLVDAGLPAIEALRAATLGGAQALGVADQLGSIAPGLLADLLVVDGDPREDPRLLLRPDAIWLVLRNGDPVAGAALEPTVTWASPTPTST
jgi:imidazolonepropionase-like amidohydrolase